MGGRIPLPPRYAFGVFYSRYRAYNDIGEMVILVFPMYMSMYLYDSLLGSGA